jgi:alpha-1,3-fucosyltransferase
LSSNYYFYGSFESTLIPGYVTEKFYRRFIRNTRVIPIVYGGSNYSYFAPPHTYIDVNDFENTEKLAMHLKFLMNNPVEYVKYFWWLDYYLASNDDIFCKVCKVIHNRSADKQTRYYKSIKK